MSDAPTVPMKGDDSLRAHAPSVPTDGHEAAVVALVEAGSVVWWKDGGVNYFPQGEAFTVERSCRVEPLVTRQSALEAIDAVRQQAVSAREVRLVLAARAVAFGDGPDPDAIRELDAASEAYAADIPWDDEPERAGEEINWKAEWEAACSIRIRLADAARPFAELADEFSACGDGQPIGVKAASGKSDLNVGHLRRLSRALAAPDTASPASQVGIGAADEPKTSPMIAATQQATGEGDKGVHLVEARLYCATEAISRLPTATEAEAALMDELVAASAEARQYLNHLDTALSTQQAVSPPQGVVRRAVYDWIRDDAPLNQKMTTTPALVQKLIDRILAAPDAIGEEKGAGTCPRDGQPCPDDCDSDDRRHCAAVAQPEPDQ